MLIVSNSSPLIALDYLGDLDLLSRLFSGTILIPPAVVREIGGRSLPPCIEFRAPVQPVGPRVLRASLGAGESEAISLALEVNADLILLDDKAARRLAKILGLTVLGTLGLFVRGKDAGLIFDLQPKLDRLRTLPFHISPALYAEILASVGE